MTDVAEAPARPKLDLEFPKVRMAMIIYPKEKDTKITVREGFEWVFIDFLPPGSSIEKTIKLTIPEARALTDHLNRACRRIIGRPDYRP